MNHHRIALVVLMATLRPVTADASITIISSITNAFAGDMVGGDSVASFSGISIPTSTTLTAIDGTSQSKNQINWSTSGAETILSLDMDHQRNAGALFSYAVTGGGVRFMANASEPYSMSGYYRVTDAGPNASEVYFYALLFDATLLTYEYVNQQISQSTANEQFMLGETAGDTTNVLFGSATGNLISGHIYEWGYYNYIDAYPDADQGASAVGNMTLQIGSVPEPLSFLVWSCLIASAVVIRFARTK